MVAMKDRADPINILMQHFDLDHVTQPKLDEKL